jgi:hypothetical protein
MHGCCGNDLDLQPGEVWLIECPAAAVPAFARRALAAADVVLYDRTLAPLLAKLLAPGSYTEPVAAPAADKGQAIATRAVKLAAEGWRVVQLVPTCGEWRQQLRDSAENGSPVLQPVAVAADDPLARCEARRVVFRQFDGETIGSGRPTLIVGLLAAGATLASSASTANGLAG